MRPAPGLGLEGGRWGRRRPRLPLRRVRHGRQRGRRGNARAMPLGALGVRAGLGPAQACHPRRPQHLRPCHHLEALGEAARWWHCSGTRFGECGVRAAGYRRGPRCPPFPCASRAANAACGRLPASDALGRLRPQRPPQRQHLAQHRLRGRTLLRHRLGLGARGRRLLAGPRARLRGRLEHHERLARLRASLHQPLGWKGALHLEARRHRQRTPPRPDGVGRPTIRQRRRTDGRRQPHTEVERERGHRRDHKQEYRQGVEPGRRGRPGPIRRGRRVAAPGGLHRGRRHGPAVGDVER
mmetsp:Transcript_56469/g.163746  ORF Transcript_56469/g.163746 Transcript_56469/m.163746 type:complete len:297 (-) Transcript_56469:1305-2195(-)